MRNYTCTKPARFKCLTISVSTEPQPFGGSLNHYKVKNNVPLCDETENVQTITLEMLSMWKLYSRMFIAVSLYPLVNKFLIRLSHEFATSILNLKGDHI